MYPLVELVDTQQLIIKHHLTFLFENSKVKTKYQV